MTWTKQNSNGDIELPHPRIEAEKIVQDAIDYMLGSGNPAHVVDADWFRLKWTQAVRELIEWKNRKPGKESHKDWPKL